MFSPERVQTAAPYVAASVVLLCTLWVTLHEPLLPSLAETGDGASEARPSIGFYFQAGDCEDNAATAAALESAARESGFAFHVYLLDSSDRLTQVQEQLADRGLRSDVTPADRGTSKFLRQLGHTNSPVMVVKDRSGRVRQIHSLPLHSADMEQLHGSLSLLRR